MKKDVIKTIKKYMGLTTNEIENLIEIPPSPELGDFAFPCFAVGKKLKKNPAEIAQDITKKIKSKEFEKVEAKGPYVNFFVDKTKLAKKTLETIKMQKEEYGSKKLGNEKIMVEFSQPNTHKAFHVGHIRGTSLGESISRILEFTGNKVIRANYSGDTGMHIAKWLWSYQKFHAKEKLKEEESWIASIYVEAIKKLEQTPESQEEVEEINRKLESGEEKKLNYLWKKTRQSSINAWKKIYNELNTKFSIQYFESELEKPAKAFVKSLVKKKIAKISEGATIINFEDQNQANLGVFLLLRKDGTVLYGGKDLGLAEKKFKEFKLNKSYYIIGREQELYIHQVFKTLELAKSKAAGKSFYIPLSEVRLPTGKMSSRTGDNVLYSNFKKELIDYAKEEIKKRHKINTKELEKRSLLIAIASMKYAMLRQDLNKTIVFNKKESISFEGNTGPYLLYTYARAKSILRKAKYKQKKFKIKDLNDSEKSLVLQLTKFPEIIEKAYKTLSPSLIANYAHQLAQTFNEFYHKNKVIGSKEESFRLVLVDASSQVLKNALYLLGIETLERM